MCQYTGEYLFLIRKCTVLCASYRLLLKVTIKLLLLCLNQQLSFTARTINVDHFDQSLHLRTPLSPSIWRRSTFLPTICRPTLGSVAVARWTRDQEVAGSTPTAALFGQQPWASCSHLTCLCLPNSVTWYLASAFMLKAPYCWQRYRVQWTREYCRAVLRWSSNCIEPRYKSSALPFTQAAFDSFYSMALGLLDRFYPQRNITLSSSDPSYMTPEIKAKLRRKNRLMRSGRVEEASALH